MTRDEIMAMSPDELRVAVAKAKGWRVYIINKGDFESLEYSTEEMPYVARHCPDWPASIADAWELVEEIRQSGAWVYVDTDNTYTCAVQIVGVDNEITEYFSTADIAPLAISRAWLMWKREEE